MFLDLGPVHMWDKYQLISLWEEIHLASLGWRWNAFQRIKTRHAEHSPRLTGLARQINYAVDMGNFHPTSRRSHLAQGGI